MGETDDSLKNKDVLHMLQPSTNLKKLRIFLYGGTSFPCWLGDSSFSNMVSLCIDNCEYCVTLPPLGQLPSLKDLSIGGMSILETIGPEFYGRAVGGSDSSFQPFPALEKLKFKNMSNWKEWLTFHDQIFPFPRFKTLKFSNCPELRGHLPSNLPSIEKLQIFGCDHLLVTPPTQPWLSSIKNIYIERDSDSQSDTNMTQWSLLESDSPCLLQDIRIGSCHVLLSFPKMIIKSSCLRELELYGIPSLTAFPSIGLPTSLQTLRIQKCDNLTFLPLKMWSNYTSLVYLYLRKSCDTLTSFPLNCFPMLQTLSIDECRSLESIFISETSSFSSSSLQNLFVGDCEALKSIPQRMDILTALGALHLYNLPTLKLFYEGGFLPPNLRSFCFVSVRITKPLTEWGLQGLTTLSSMNIGGDDIVNSLLKEQLLPISLVDLTVSDLAETKSLAENGFRHLSSLETLTFSWCSRLKSLSENMFPSALKSLKFKECSALESLPEDSLPNSLNLLRIERCPFLEERYKSKEHWSKIAHIPVIQINEQVII